jgi:hypothetical protein
MLESKPRESSDDRRARSPDQATLAGIPEFGSSPPLAGIAEFGYSPPLAGIAEFGSSPGLAGIAEYGSSTGRRAGRRRSFTKVAHFAQVPRGRRGSGPLDAGGSLGGVAPISKPSRLPATCF